MALAQMLAMKTSAHQDTARNVFLSSLLSKLPYFLLQLFQSTDQFAKTILQL